MRANGWPTRHGDELRFYYGAYASWNADENHCVGADCSGIGLATMKVDRYAAMV